MPNFRYIKSLLKDTLAMVAEIKGFQIIFFFLLISFKNISKSIKKLLKNCHLKPHKFSYNKSMTENICINWLNLGRHEFSQN